jgi:hypothetical protein
MKEKMEAIVDRYRPKAGDGKRWTIMVYLAGSNNLVDEMVYAVRELRGKAITDVVNLFVQFDTGSDVWLFPPSAFQVKPNEDPTKLENFDLERVGEREDYPRLITTQGILQSFVTTCMLASVTDHYMLILSGHGSGAVGNFLLGTTTALTIPALGRTFDSVKESLYRRNHPRGRSDTRLFDILGLDSCTMSMAEIGYEVEPHVDYMIGAEGFEFSTGWPYDRLISLNLQRTPCQLAVDIVKTYCEYYFNYSIGDLSTDQSALILKDFCKSLKPIVAELARALSGALGDRQTREAILVSHWAAQSYKIEQYTDLWDFCDQLKLRFPEGQHIHSVAHAVQDAIDKAVLISTYSGARFQNSHGIAIYFPWADIIDAKGGHDLSAYRLLKFARESGWADFLQSYFLSTQCPPRDVPGEDVPKSSRLNARPGLFGTYAEEFGLGQGKGGVPEDSRGGVPEDSRGGVPEDSRGGVPEDSRGGVPEDSRSGLAASSNSDAQLLYLKIGQMKNPPTMWFPCDVDGQVKRGEDKCK